LRPDFPAARFFEVFFGTFAPAALASERPIAIACLRLVTFRPERPLFKVPALHSFIARSTLADAFFEYFRAMIVLPLQENNRRRRRWFPLLGLLDAVHPHSHGAVRPPPASSRP
jgi:hypothetical protein